MGILLLAAGAAAQTTGATVSGTVTDASQAVLPSVKVALTSVETGLPYQTTTDLSGNYTLLEIPPAEYILTAELSGFKKFVQHGVVLAVAQVARIDMQLQVGGVTETVEVTAEAPLLNTEISSRSEVVTSEEISEMPLNGRDFNELAYLAAGVVPKAQGGQGSFASINGARADNTNFIVDGINNQNPRLSSAQARPPIDALQEFRVETSTFSAEYGRMAGGVLNMALRSGTSAFHGTVSEFLRNDIFDARNFFDPEKLKLRRNQFGASIGGPVVVPRLFNGRQSTFFYAAWESYRQRIGRSRLNRVPTPLERGGDFSQTVDNRGRRLTVFDPLTRLPFDGNRVPRERMHPTALKVLPYYPLPNRAGANNLVVTAVDPDDWDSFSVRTDRRVAGRHNLSFRALLRDNRVAEPFSGSDVATFGHREEVRQHMYSLGYTHMFSPTLLHDSRFGFTRTSNHQRTFKSTQDFNAELGLPSPGDPRLLGFPRFTVRGLVAIGDEANKPTDFTVNNFQWTSTLTKVIGRLSTKGGAEVLRTQFFQPYFNNNRGTFNFNGRWTADRNGVEGPADNQAQRSGAAFADLLLGLPYQNTRQVGWVDSYVFTTRYGFFVQNDWKVRSNLTLNLGARYELLKPPIEKYNHWTNFLPGLGRSVIAGEEGFPRSLILLDKNDFAPRVGFAWRPGGSLRTVVRAGYGIFYGAVPQNPLRSQLSAVYPFTYAQTYTANFSRVGSMSLSDPFPVGSGSQTGINSPNSFQYDAPSAYVQQYNFTIERQVGRRTVADIAYVGSKGTHLGRQFNLNQPLRRAEFAPTFPRPFPAFSTIDYFDFSANSNYNALVTSLRNRGGRGLTYRLSYSFSKAIDDASQLSGRSDGGFDGAQDIRNLRLERGRSDFDRRHTFVANYLYELPFGRGRRYGADLSGWRQLLAGGWQLGGLTRFHTGQPLTIRVSTADLDAGEANRPDRLRHGGLDQRTPDRWFDVEAFEPVPRGSYRPGNSGRNILDGPRLLNFDFALYKRIALRRERTNLQLRIESFNLLNHTNFRLPVETIDTNTSGTIRQANDGRQWQVAIRYQF